MDGIQNQASPLMKKPTFVCPATPKLKQLGYGTGVGVYHVDRSPKNGTHHSPWALKKLLKSNGAVMHMAEKRLRIEADILRKLNHPNIVGFRAFTKTADGYEVLAMEECERSLQDLIERQNENYAESPFPATEIMKVATQVSDALDYLHNTALLLHGDIKSGNILVKGHFDSIKLCDFGVSLPLTFEGKFDSTKKLSGIGYTGTRLWNAPEVCEEGDAEQIITDKADIFAFGLTLWEMMSLRSPHLGSLMSDEDTDYSFDDSCESSFMNSSLGTIGKRPAIPDTVLETDEYIPILDIFLKCTEHDYEKRLSARQIKQLCNEINAKVEVGNSNVNDGKGDE